MNKPITTSANQLLPSDRSSSTKEQLEIAKLRLELRYIKRTFWIQVLNPIILAGIAVFVFVFFQRPQVTEMEQARLSNERVQVANSLISAQNLPDETNRQLMIEALARQWPQYTFVTDVAQSNALVIAARSAEKGTCATISAHIAELKRAFSTLRGRELDDLFGLGKGGPVAQTIKTQMAQVQDELVSARKSLSDRGCPQ